MITFLVPLFLSIFPFDFHELEKSLPESDKKIIEECQKKVEEDKKEITLKKILEYRDHFVKLTESNNIKEKIVGIEVLKAIDLFLLFPEHGIIPKDVMEREKEEYINYFNRELPRQIERVKNIGMLLAEPDLNEGSCPEITDN